LATATSRRSSAPEPRPDPPWLPVTNAAGNLVDENGNQINGAFPPTTQVSRGSARSTPRRRSLRGGRCRNRAPGDQWVHRRHPRQRAHPRPYRLQRHAPALGSGDPCYVAQAQYYNPAFATFTRLAADGITAKNSLFIITPDEGDHEEGETGRAIQPTPPTATAPRSAATQDPGCRVHVPSQLVWRTGKNLTGLLATQTSDTTPSPEHGA
jgi:hypothetical protein